MSIKGIFTTRSIPRVPATGEADKITAGPALYLEITCGLTLLTWWRNPIMQLLNQ
jgi:hypothetical protein